MKRQNRDDKMNNEYKPCELCKRDNRTIYKISIEEVGYKLYKDENDTIGTIQRHDLHNHTHYICDRCIRIMWLQSCHFHKTETGCNGYLHRSFEKLHKIKEDTDRLMEEDFEVGNQTT